MFLVVYMSDLLISSKGVRSRLKHLNVVSSRLKEHKPYVLPQKSESMKKEIDFLGLLVVRKGSKANPGKTVLITWPKPKTLTNI